MKKEILTGWQLREEYRNGRRDFSSSEIQWADFSNTNLSDINLSNSKISVATFFTGNLKNADFSGCDFYGTSFNFADLSNANFDRSLLNWVRLDNAIFLNTSMRNATLNHVTLINCIVSELKLDGSVTFNIFHKAEEIPEAEIQGLIAEVGNLIDSTDLDRRLWLKTTLNYYLKEVDKKNVSAQSAVEPYSRHDSNYQNRINLYQNLDTIFNNLIGAYNSRNAYKSENTYTDKKKY